MLSLSDLLFYFIIFTVFPTGYLLYYYRDLIFGWQTSGTFDEIQLSDNRLVEFIDSACDEIYILSGEACPTVFTDKTEAFLRRAQKRGLNVKVIMGPFVLARHLTKNESIIPKLANEGILELYLLNKREETHFTVDKKGKINIELPHEPNAQNRMVLDFKRNQYEARHFRRYFIKLLNDKDKIQKYIPFKTDLLFITEEELEKLKLMIKGKKSTNINDYSRDKIKEMIYSIRLQG